MNFPCRFKRIMQSLGFFVKTISPKTGPFCSIREKHSPARLGPRNTFLKIHAQFAYFRTICTKSSTIFSMD